MTHQPLTASITQGATNQGLANLFFRTPIELEVSAEQLLLAGSAKIRESSVGLQESFAHRRTLILDSHLRDVAAEPPELN
jgi:hypothetical protein